MTLIAAGCAEPEAEPADKGDGQGSDLRIASLSPAVSRTLVDLGLEARIVGRSPFCDFLDPAIPIVGDLRNVNYERLIELDPTHVLVQTSQKGIDPTLRELAVEHGWRLEQWSGVDSIDDIERMVRELPAILCAPGSGELEELTARSAELLNTIAAALAPGRGAGELWRGRTLLVYALTPVGVFGRGTYLHDVLVRFGATNAVSADGWVELTLEDITRLNPQAIIVIRPSPRGTAVKPTDAMEAAGVLATLDVDAVRAGRIEILTHPDALMPSTAISEVAGEMCRILRRLKEGSVPGS